MEIPGRTVGVAAFTSIRVLEQGSRLTIVCPPYYLAAGVAVFMITLGIAGALGIARFSGNKASMFVLLLAVIPFLLVAVGLATTGAVAVIDRTTGYLEIRTRIFGFQKQKRRYPISEIDRAAMESGRGTRRIVFVTTDGTSLSLGSLTSQPGHGAAVDAVNKFLRSGK
jgi:hypothetical protein